MMILLFDSLFVINKVDKIQNEFSINHENHRNKNYEQNVLSKVLHLIFHLLYFFKFINSLYTIYSFMISSYSYHFL
jgi:hypothetical protein